MQKIIYFVILIALVSSQTVTIGTCAKYSWEGRDCQKCVQNYHLFNGVCFSDIQNCVDYKSGITCQKCSESTILVSNQCLDIQSLQKMFKSQNERAQQLRIENNLKIISKLVDFVQRGFLRGNGGKLVRFDVRGHKQVQRWFLLYQFESQFKSYQRIIVDMDLKSQTFNAVDFSSLRNPDDFSAMFWKDVNNSNQVLAVYSDLYSSSTSYLKLSVRKAILSEVTQFQILTVSQDKVQLREICSSKTNNFILNEFIHTFSTTSTSSASSVSVTFHPYELSFKGSQIDAEMDANIGLFNAVTQVKNSPLWNHTLTQVVESGKALNWTQFSIVGQNPITSFKAVVNYNPLNGSASIIKMTLEADVQQTGSEQIHTKYPTLTQQTLQQQVNRNYTEQDGCVTHTSFDAPFDGDLKQMAEKLSKIKKDATLSDVRQKLDPSTPFIQGPGLYGRRIVVSSFCQGYNYKEVAYVQGDNITTKEYFTYYLEEDLDGEKKWYFLGNNTKNQSSAVYSNPQAYPINFVDPSFVNYPLANLYTQNGVASEYLNNLSDDDRLTFMGLSKNLTTERDRHLGKMSRYSFDAKNSTQAKFRATGWKILAQPDGFFGFSPFMSLLCPEIMITETLVIGSSRSEVKSNVQSVTKNGNNLVRV